MIMTLFVVIDDRKERKIYFDFEHSNWHHIKILQHLMKHFQYGMFGGKHSAKGDLDINKIKEIYKKHSNENVEQFEEIKDFRSLRFDKDSLNTYSMDGYVIIHLRGDCQDIYVNVSSVENDRDVVLKSFRNEIKNLRREN